MKILKVVRFALARFFLNPSLFLKRSMLESIALFAQLPKVFVAKEVNSLLFPFHLEEHIPTEKSMYFGFYEMGVINAMRNFLKEGDTFIDVGAKIGYMSAWGAGFVGITGETHCFEPVPKFFSLLQEFAQMNKTYDIKLNQIALGETKGNVEILVSKEGYSTCVPESLKGLIVEEKFNVPVQRLDTYIEENKLSNVRFIKIDVDGYEFFILKGLENFFLNTKELPIIMCEISPSLISVLGYQLADLLNYMKRFSYEPFNVFNSNRLMFIGDIQKEKEIDIIFKPARRAFL